MLFRLIIEHHDLFQLIGPYMSPGFKVTLGMKPFGADGPIFSCAITRDWLFAKKVKRKWGVAAEGDTLEEAVEKTVTQAKVMP